MDRANIFDQDMLEDVKTNLLSYIDKIRMLFILLHKEYTDFIARELHVVKQLTSVTVDLSPELSEDLDRFRNGVSTFFINLNSFYEQVLYKS